MVTAAFPLHDDDAKTLKQVARQVDANLSVHLPLANFMDDILLKTRVSERDLNVI